MRPKFEVIFDVILFQNEKYITVYGFILLIICSLLSISKIPEFCLFTVTTLTESISIMENI